MHHYSLTDWLLEGRGTERPWGWQSLIPLAKIHNSGKQGCATSLITSVRTGALGHTWAQVCSSACFCYKVVRTIIIDCLWLSHSQEKLIFSGVELLLQASEGWESWFSACAVMPLSPAVPRYRWQDSSNAVPWWPGPEGFASALMLLEPRPTLCLQQVVLCRDCPQRVLQEQEGDRGESCTTRHQDHQPQRQTAQRGERVAASAAQVYLIKPQSNSASVLHGHRRGSSLCLAPGLCCQGHSRSSGMVMVSELRVHSFKVYFIFYTTQTTDVLSHSTINTIQHQPLCQKRKKSTEQFMARAMCHDCLVL